MVVVVVKSSGSAKIEVRGRPVRSRALAFRNNLPAGTRFPFQTSAAASRRPTCSYSAKSIKHDFKMNWLIPATPFLPP